MPLLLLLPAALYAQEKNFPRDYHTIAKFAVSLYVDQASGKMYDLKTIMSAIETQPPVTLYDSTISGDTIYFKAILSTPFRQEKTRLYKKYMKHVLPDFTVTDIHGKSYSSADLRGKVVLLNFWSATNTPCLVEMPYLNDLADSLAPDRFVLLAPRLDSSEPTEKVLLNHPFRYDIISDGAAIAKSLGVTEYPTHLIIDQTGKVVSVIEWLTVDTITNRPLIKEELQAVLKKLRR